MLLAEVRGENTPLRKFASSGSRTHNHQVMSPTCSPLSYLGRALHVCSTCVLKTLWEKEKLLVMSNFSFFPLCFLPFWRTFCHFYHILNCRLQTLSVWKPLKFAVWEKVKDKKHFSVLPLFLVHTFLVYIYSTDFFTFYQSIQFNPFQTTKFRLFQTLKICRQQFKFDVNGRKFFKRMENVFEKGEIARQEQFLLSPQCFEKICTADM